MQEKKSDLALPSDRQQTWENNRLSALSSESFLNTSPSNTRTHTAKVHLVSIFDHPFLNRTQYVRTRHENRESIHLRRRYRCLGQETFLRGSEEWCDSERTMNQPQNFFFFYCNNLNIYGILDLNFYGIFSRRWSKLEVIYGFHYLSSTAS